MEKETNSFHPKFVLVLLTKKLEQNEEERICENR
jgi:hypothetical protein